MSAALARFLAPAALLLGLSPARAEAQTKQACYDAYEQGQRLRRAGQLRRARENLLVCARDPCSLVFQPECVGWLAEVDRVQPTLVVDVRDRGAAITQVVVRVDGEVLATKLDGREMPVDPGEHSFRVELPTGTTMEKREVVLEGEKARRLVFEIPKEPAKPARDAPLAEAPPFPWGGVLSSAAAGLSIAGFAYFGLTGLARRSTLDACGLYCNRSDIDYTRTHFVIADVFLGVSVIALGAATYLWLRWARTPTTEPRSAASRVPMVRFTF
jgi:hypothetical protein